MKNILLCCLSFVTFVVWLTWIILFYLNCKMSYIHLHISRSIATVIALFMPLHLYCRITSCQVTNFTADMFLAVKSAKVTTLQEISDHVMKCGVTEEISSD